MAKINITIFIFLMIIFTSCKNNSDKLFKLKDSKETGLYFINEIKENEKLNIFTYEYLYNGAGIAVGDINNDSLPDIFMGGNLFGGRLFLNKGHLKFEQISETANVFQNGYSTGVSIIDINEDGWNDIYICKSLSNDAALRANVLLINNHNNTFTNKAQEYGLDDKGFSQQACFCDIDNDGDLDMYLVNHRIDFQNALTLNFEKNSIDSNNNYVTDKLYKNNGNGKFEDITKQSGISNFAFGLAVTHADINNDGWQDFYVSCDYASKDQLYINNQNGTFTNKIDSQLFHISKNSMGNTIADINNDGLLDIMTLDMLAEDNYRQKLLKGQSPRDLFHLANQYGFHFQVMRNCLQINNGNETFSEVGQLAGVSHTDWSWSPLFEDFDNDGLKDLLITNGCYRDVTDLDYIKYGSNETVVKDGGVNNVNKNHLLEKMKQTPTLNYLYKNNADLNFENVSQKWGIDKVAFSNGAACADFDNDGDIDILSNTFNDEAMLYENTLQENNYIDIQLIGDSKNKFGIGTKVYVQTDSNIQYQELSICKGFLSSQNTTLHFGIGNQKSIKKIIVAWSNQKMEVLENVTSNQKIYCNQSQANQTYVSPYQTSKQLLQTLVNASSILNFSHQENTYNDFKAEPLLENMYSNNCPIMIKGDVNNDGKTDIYFGGSSGFSGKLFIQGNNSFVEKKCIAFEADKNYEDSDGLFLDIDKDADLDLIITSGSNETNDEKLLQHRLYINDGQGNFKKENNKLPNVSSNATCIADGDFDIDGDIDLFIGGGVKHANFPNYHTCMLWRNDNGKFIDISNTLPNNGNLGIITSALWQNINNKNKQDELIITGHWTGINLLKYNTKKKKFEMTTFKNSDNSLNITNNLGLWNCIKKADFDNDGDIDFVVGNRGLNSFYKATYSYPANLLYADFDDNGSIDAIPNYVFANKKLYPKYTMDELFAQIPMIRSLYNSYADFSNATTEQMFPKDKYNNVQSLTINNFASSFIENLGDGNLKISPLPNLAQVSITTDFLIQDFNNDNYLDILAIGNQYQTDVETGRFDAAIGCLLINNKKGDFEALSPASSGVKIIGDSRRITSFDFNNKNIILVTKNNASIQLLEANP